MAPFSAAPTETCLYVLNVDKPWLKHVFSSLFLCLFHSICNSSEAQIWEVFREGVVVCVCKRECNYYNLHSSNYLLIDTVKKTNKPL